MRKREIHTVAHWCMMFLLLMFPILMVGISGFGNSKYDDVQSVVYSNANGLAQVYGAEYEVRYNSSATLTSYQSLYVLDNRTNAIELYGGDTSKQVNRITIERNGNSLYFYYADNTYQEVANWFETSSVFYYFAGSTDVISNDTNNRYYNVFRVTYVEQAKDYRNDINEWCDQFIDLPINSWYKSLMNVIGVGFTNSSVMNVIYVMPVYILWVFIFDVIVDCFLVIIKLPHKLLNRLSGGENE